jgi:hypothetical protein
MASLGESIGDLDAVHETFQVIGSSLVALPFRNSGTVRSARAGAIPHHSRPAIKARISIFILSYEQFGRSFNSGISNDIERGIDRP